MPELSAAENLVDATPVQSGSLADLSERGPRSSRSLETLLSRLLCLLKLALCALDPGLRLPRLR